MCARQINRGNRFAGGMLTPQKFQRRIVQGLNAQGHTIDPGLAIGREPIRLHRCRIGFQGHFQSVSRGQDLCGAGYQRRSRLRCHQGRCAPTKEDRSQRAVFQTDQRSLQLPQ